MRAHVSTRLVIAIVSLVCVSSVSIAVSRGPATQPSSTVAQQFDQVRIAADAPFDGAIISHAVNSFTRGREIFRFDTFGSEAFWGGRLRLHEPIVGA
jgi:hypothetical protein